MKFIFSNDDAGGQHGAQAVGWFEGLTAWLDKKGIPGTFFWIPKSGGKPTDQDPLWMPAIRKAREAGHDFQLHGLTHHCLEFGVPQASIRRHAPKTFDDYEHDRAKWEREHAVPSLRKKFDEGIATYERAFGRRPVVFRAPCFGMCANAYVAMHQAGLRYSSSRSVNPSTTGFLFTGRPDLEPWQPDYDGKPFTEPPGVVEYPCLEDLVIGSLRAEDFDRVLGLFKRDLTHYMRSLGDSGIGVFGSHYYAIGKQMERVTMLYARLLDWMAEQGVTEWVTFHDALRAGGW